MEAILLIIAISLLIIGLIGAVVPAIPGPPIAWVGLLLEFFIPNNSMSIVVLIITFMIALIITILDFVLPTLQTKKSGGTKYGTIGSSVGLIIGLFTSFLGPWGILLGPFLGAFFGELIHDSKDINKALKSAWASFIGFLSGTFIKIITVLIFSVIFILKLK